MKTSLVMVALVAVGSSLVTVGVVELLRNPRPNGPAVLGIETPSEAPVPITSSESAGHAQRAPAEEAGPAALVRPPRSEKSWAELEQRIAALELQLASTPRRVPLNAGAPELSAGDDLRQLVLDWVAEEREARWRSEELDQEERARMEREFEARQQAFMFAQQYSLDPWQQEKFAELFLEMKEREAELEASIDPTRDTPEEVEARWIEFDEWIDQRERELTALVGQELFDEIYGEE